MELAALALLLLPTIITSISIRTAWRGDRSELSHETYEFPDDVEGEELDRHAELFCSLQNWTTSEDAAACHHEVVAGVINSQQRGPATCACARTLRHAAQRCGARA